MRGSANSCNKVVFGADETQFFTVREKQQKPLMQKCERFAPTKHDFFVRSNSVAMKKYVFLRFSSDSGKLLRPGSALYCQGRLCTPRADFILPGPTLCYQGRLCTTRADFVLPGPTLCQGRLCTARADFVLPGPTLYYQGRLCTTRADFVLPGPTLHYHVCMHL